MSIIDFHTHLSVNNEEYGAFLKNNNIERAIVMPFEFNGYDWIKIAFEKEKPKSYIEQVLKRLDIINNSFLDKVKKYENVIPAIWVSPEFENLDNLISDNRAKIIKLIPVLDNLTNDYYKRVEDLIELAVKYKKLIMIHSGWGVRVEPINELASKFSDGTFVIAHMKEDDDSYNFARIKALNNENVFCEISYFPHSKRIWQYVKKGFGKKLLFGSDFRDINDEQTFNGYLAMLNQAKISQDEKEDIIYNNAFNLLKSNNII